jgi:ketosteroid isomerase-like protein
MSENLGLVRSLYAAWERGDFRSADWAHQEIVYVVVDGPEPGTFRGRAEMAAYGRRVLDAWEDWRVEGEEYRELKTDRVLVLDHHSGRGRTSGLEVGRMGGKGAVVFHIRDGQVTKMVAYWDRDRALADLGLKE